MNRTQLLDLISSVAGSFGYSVCTTSSLPSAASFEPFPLFCLHSLTLLGGSSTSLSMASYRLEFSLLSLLPRGGAADSPELALLERDGRDMLHALAHDEAVVAADMVAAVPASAPLSHAFDAGLAVTADITVFLP